MGEKINSFEISIKNKAPLELKQNLNVSLKRIIEDNYYVENYNCEDVRYLVT